MHVRVPDIQPEEGPLLWSKVPEFSIMYNAYSSVIPYVEYYLNSVINKVRREHCADHPALARELETFVKQETVHAQYHVRFNQRMFDQNIEGLRPLIDRMVAELKLQREKRSLAFNVAYCVGFECIATYAAIYIHERCDEYFRDADPHGANLLLWHVAEEFEHRSVCHDAFRQVSGNYFVRIGALLYAFWHVGGSFLSAERLMLAHYNRDVPEAQRRASQRRWASLFWRQVRFVAPRMIKILLPFYDPSRLKVPQRIATALQSYQQPGSLRGRLGVDWANAA